MVQGLPNSRFASGLINSQLAYTLAPEDRSGMDRGGDLANRVRRQVAEEVHGGKEFVSARFIPGSFFSSHRRHAVLLDYPRRVKVTLQSPPSTRSLRCVNPCFPSIL